MKLSRKYLVLASLYIVQSVPFSFLKTGFQSLLRDQHIDHALISRITAILMLPWVIKFLWAPLVDKWCGNMLPRIRKAILLFQVLGAALLGVVASLSFPGDLQPVILVFFLLSLLSSTQDIAIDALAVLTLPKKEHGLGNTMQIGGYYMGEVLGGAIILIILDQLGWHWAMGAFIVFFLLPFIPVFKYRATNLNPPQPAVKGLKNVGEFLKLPGMGMWLVVMMIFMGNQILSRFLLPSLLTDIGYSKTEIGTLIGILGNSASVGGAILGGLIINRIGRKNSLVGFGLLKTILTTGYFLLATNTVSTPAAYSIIILNDFVSGLATVTLFTIMMDKCRLTSPGTDFTTQQCANQLAILFFVIISGILVKQAAGNYTLLFTVAIIIGVIGVLLAGLGLTRKSLDNGSGIIAQAPAN